MKTDSLILVIEDTPELLHVTSRALQSAGYRTIGAETGQQGLRLAQQNHPDMILLDVVLPDLDGLEVCRRIRRMPECSDCFVVLVSGIKTTSSAQVEGLHATADGYIVRPLSNAALVAHVEALLRLQKSQRQLQRAHDQLEERVAERTRALSQVNEQLRAEIAERRQVEMALRQSEQRFRRSFEMGVVGIAIETSAGEWIAVNQRLCEMLGYTRDELMEKHWSDLTHPDDLDADQAQFDQLIAGKIDQYTLEKRFLRQDGDVIHCLISVTCSRNPNGDIDRVLGYAIDITERVRIEKELRHALADKDVLFREVHHRVKNNLAIVSHLLEWQTETIDDPDALRALIDSQHRILSMARVHECLYSTGQLYQVDMADYVVAIGRYLWDAYDAYDIRLSLDVRDVTLDIDHAIPCGLIVNELLSNALQHAFPDRERTFAAQSTSTTAPEVRVGLHIDGSRVELTVSDNGSGLAADLDLAHPESLGLDLVQLFAQQLRGTLAIDGDQGTTFQLTFASEWEE